MWVVTLSDGEKDVAHYGPMHNEVEADRFAAFLTEEVDPARTRWVPTYNDLTLLSPVRAMLDWRDHCKDGA